MKAVELAVAQRIVGVRSPLRSLPTRMSESISSSGCLETEHFAFTAPPDVPSVLFPSSFA